MDELIVVRGRATVTAVADRGVLTVTTRVKQPTPAGAERAMAELSSAVDAVLTRFAAALSARNTAHLSIRPNTYWHPESGASLSTDTSGSGRSGSLCRTPNRQARWSGPFTTPRRWK